MGTYLYFYIVSEIIYAYKHFHSKLGFPNKTLVFESDPLQ